MTDTVKRPSAEDVARREILLTAGRLTTMSDELVTAYRKRKNYVSGPTPIESLDAMCSDIVELNARIHRLLALYPQSLWAPPQDVIDAAQVWVAGDERQAIRLLERACVAWVTQSQIDEAEEEARDAGRRAERLRTERAKVAR